VVVFPCDIAGGAGGKGNIVGKNRRRSEGQKGAVHSKESVRGEGLWVETFQGGRRLDLRQKRGKQNSAFKGRIKPLIFYKPGH